MQLTLLQIDPTAAIAPSADLVAWSRVGWGLYLAGADWPRYESTL